jgi:hypothetical protein
MKGAFIVVELTPAQQHLIKWLKVMKVEEGSSEFSFNSLSIMPL